MAFRFILTLALASMTAATNARERGYYEALFYSWLSEFKIKPASGEQFVHFLQNFANNEDLINSHNSKANVTYTLGHNQYSHMSFEEFRQYMHLGIAKKPSQLKADFVHAAPADLSAVPTSVDWTTAGAVTPVKDQGSCGSCWSFSTTGALEGAYYNKYKSLVSLSEQDLVDCDTIKNGGSNLGCNGGDMDAAFSWTKKNGGLCTEATYPYTSGTTQKSGTCNEKSCTKIANSAPASYSDVSTNSDSALMSAIAKQPVSIAIEADQAAFQLYKSGVFTGTCGTNLDHGVLAVGYGTDSGSDYYKVKNSWGTSWGEKGYIRLVRGISQKGGQCGILMEPSYPNL